MLDQSEYYVDVNYYEHARMAPAYEPTKNETTIILVLSFTVESNEGLVSLKFAINSS